MTTKTDLKALAQKTYDLLAGHLDGVSGLVDGSLATKAQRHGTDDAREWLQGADSPDQSDVRAALASPVTPDENLINGLGYTAAAKLFGVPAYEQETNDISKAFRAACDQYNEAFNATLRAALR